jgi:hypothetical protein
MIWFAHALPLGIVFALFLAMLSNHPPAASAD